MPAGIQAARRKGIGEKMANYTVISDIGNGLVKLLRAGMVPEIIANSDAIGLCCPSDKGDMSLGLYLYEIRESEETTGRDMRASGEAAQRYPSKFLSLSYMVTAYSSSDVKFRASEEQRIIGKAFQIFMDNPVLDEEYLGEGGKGMTYPVRLELLKLDNEEKLKLWNFPDLPYKLSLFYRVYPVEMESTRMKKASRVVGIEFTAEEKKGR